ncbi:hypothetical protein HY251_09465, partial [bacterium]|nr:hypothetical protein [bacterium]
MKRSAICLMGKSTSMSRISAMSSRGRALFIALSLGCVQPTAAAVDLWTTHGPFTPESIASAGRLAVDPRTPTTLYASENLSFDCGSAIFKSTNGGDSWQNVLDAIDCVNTIAINPVDPRIVHVSVGNGFHTSRDGGISWETYVMEQRSTEDITSL